MHILTLHVAYPLTLCKPLNVIMLLPNLHITIMIVYSVVLCDILEQLE